LADSRFRRDSRHESPCQRKWAIFEASAIFFGPAELLSPTAGAGQAAIIGDIFGVFCGVRGYVALGMRAS
jgi:hypothetical protein